MTTQPEPFTYTDPIGDALTVGFIRMVTDEGPVDSVAFSVVNDPDSATAYVPLPDVERVVAAIRTAAGAQQPEPEERRAVPCSFNILRRTHAAHDWEPQPGMTPVRCPGTETDEERELREDREEVARLHAAGEHGDCAVECEVEMPSEHLRNFILAKGYPGTGGALDELLRRAGQARGTTGQDTTTPAVGEQEIRQQIRLACAIAERVPVTILEPHDYQEHATAVLPVVRAAVAAGVRRALEDAAADFDQFPTNTARVLRARAAAVAPPASERVRVCDNCGVAHQSVACHPEAYANCEQGPTA